MKITNINMRIIKFIIYFKPYKEKKKGGEDVEAVWMDMFYSNEFFKLYANIDITNMIIMNNTINT